MFLFQLKKGGTGLHTLFTPRSNCWAGMVACHVKHIIKMMNWLSSVPIIKAMSLRHTSGFSSLVELLVFRFLCLWRRMDLKGLNAIIIEY